MVKEARRRQTHLTGASEEVTILAGRYPWPCAGPLERLKASAPLTKEFELSPVEVTMGGDLDRAS